MPPRWLFLLIGFAIGATVVSRLGSLGVGRYQGVNTAAGLYVIDTTTGAAKAMGGREGVPFEELRVPAREEVPARQ